MPTSKRPSSLAPWLAVGLALASAGCSDDYQAPTVDEPHAVIEFERDYDRTAGTVLEERLRVSGQSAFTAESDVSTLGLPRIDMLLVRPEPMRLDIDAVFVHYDYRWVWETYYSGGRPYSRMVWRPVRLVLAACDGLAWLSPRDGERYVLSFQVDEAGACVTDCWVDDDDAEPADRVPCPQPSATERSELESP
ncbi:MAG TPA: hypothetical protein VLC09_03475 [Polyangiaceae bacterium]|nr:hypothetical protein [Polyangiaceae bacterium]